MFVRYAWWALALLVVFGLVGGWVLAGVVLRPLDRITDAARRAAAGSLDHRVSLPGPRDELTDLADAFDAMLARVQHTLDEERRFAANASHELRTPHAIIRTMVEVAQADPDGRDVDTCSQRIGGHERPRDRHDRGAARARARGPRCRAREGARWISRRSSPRRSTTCEADAAAPASGSTRRSIPRRCAGHPTLVSRLAANLLQNAVVHNVPGGRVSVTTSAGSAGRRAHGEQQRAGDRPGGRGDPDRAVRARRGARADGP